MEKNKSKNEIRKEDLTKKIKVKNDELNNMLACLLEWKDSEDLKDLLLKQIHSKRMEIKMLNARLKVVNAYSKILK